MAHGSQFSQGDDAYLVEVQRDAGEVDGFSLVGTLNPTTTTTTPQNYYDVDTSDLEAGNEYGIANTSSYRGNDTNVTQTFSVINEGFSAEFDDSAVDETDNESVVELDSDRQTTNYDVTVSVDGPDDFDAAMIEDLFNANGTGATVTNPDDLPMDELGYDREDGDTVDDLRDDGYVTLDLQYLANNNTVSGDELTMNFSRLDDGAGLPDAGEYEFEFLVTDTGATATDTISISESDESASFTEGAIQDTAGDIATFEFELEDTDEAWIQIGDEDSDFVEVLYVKADDETEPVEVSVNTRLLGTDKAANLDGEDVYDIDNADSFESGYHDVGAGTFSEAPDNVKLFGDDDAGSNNYGDYIVNDLGLVDSSAAGDFNQQLVRPLQATDYEIQIGGTDVDVADEPVFDADTGGEATDQLASAVLELQQPEIGDITTHTAPGASADDETEVSELVDAATAREEIAVEDRLVVQVEATGIYGALLANPDGSNYDPNWDRLEDGVSTDVMQNVINNAEEGITFEVTAESTTGNQDPLEVNLGASDSDTYIVLDEDNGQFFLIADTSSDSAFANGDAPDEETSFTAELEYDADNDDNRFEFDNTAGGYAFNATGNSVNYPYLAQGETLSSSSELDIAPRSIDFDNVNVDDVLEAENTEESEISGTTNVAPGSDATIRVSSTEASSSFRNGQSVNISDDGEVTAEFDFDGQEVGDGFETTYRVSGSSVDSIDSVLVEEGSLSEEPPEDDSEEPPEDDSEDDSTDDSEEPPEDDSEDDSTDDSTEEETPGFGALVALVAVLGAALLATRRQN